MNIETQYWYGVHLAILVCCNYDVGSWFKELGSNITLIVVVLLLNIRTIFVSIFNEDVYE